MMAAMPEVTPSVATVAETLSTMMSEPWPTSEDQAGRWLRRHGIDPDSGTERRTDKGNSGNGSSGNGSSGNGRSGNGGPGRDWDRATMEAWGNADVGWGQFGEEFVGVNWFLWRGASPEELMTAARELAGMLTQAHGAPTESTDPTVHGGTWLWRLPGHIIDIYAHHGLPRPDGFPAGEPVLQLHLDHRERSDAREAFARAHPAPRPSPCPSSPRPKPDQRTYRRTR